jgi:replicative DNA helicase
MLETQEQLEREVLGLVLVSSPESEAVELAVSRCRLDCFQSPPCRAVWEAAVQLHRSGRTVEPVSVTEVCIGRGVFQTSRAEVFIAQLIEDVHLYETVHLDLYIQKLLTAAERRRLGAVGAWLAAAAETSQEPLELRAEVLRRLEAAEGDGPAEFCTMAEAIQLAMLPQSRPISTGWQSLDSILNGGWRGGQLVVAAGRPGNGKSVFLLQSAMAAARAGVPVLFASLEMQPAELAKRAMRAQSQDRAAALPVVFNRAGCSRLDQLVAAARKHHRRGQCGLVVVDYLQLVSVPGKQQRWEAVGEISRALKLLAAELDVPVLAAVQASRAADSGSSIQLSHMRESGSIEQDADIVIALNASEAEDGAERDFDVLKHRAGSRGKFPVILVDGCKFIVEHDADDWATLRPSWSAEG